MGININIKEPLCYSRSDLDRKYPELVEDLLEPEINHGGGFVHWLVEQGHGGLRSRTKDNLCGLRRQGSAMYWRGVDVVLQCKAQWPDKWEAYMALVAMGIVGKSNEF